MLGTLSSTLPMILMYSAFKKVKAQKGGIIKLLDPLFPILFAFIIFGEVPNMNVLIGGALILIGISLTYINTAKIKERLVRITTTFFF